MEVKVIIFGLLAVAALLVLLQFVARPVKLLWKLVLNSAAGLALLLLFNFFGAWFGASLPINLVTILLVGFLGLPGMAVLLCVQFFIL
ncbi:MAG: pro-sigmaK processing inhibitor BofA family protein [Syntrophomonadaceae bacterium]|nr:pro-sigmaK processing inhibitor BofA family protein [Syntrophomonadaceae bacterium]